MAAHFHWCATHAFFAIVAKTNWPFLNLTRNSWLEIGLSKEIIVTFSRISPFSHALDFNLKSKSENILFHYNYQGSFIKAAKQFDSFKIQPDDEDVVSEIHYLQIYI